MRRFSVCLPKPIYRFFLCAALLMLPLSHSLYGEADLDDELYRSGYDCHMQGDYPRAAMFFFAYIRSNPERMQREPSFAQQLMAAYQSNLFQAQEAIRERNELKVQLISCRGSSGQLPPPPPPLPLPPPRPAGSLPQVNRRDIEQSYLRNQLSCWQNYSTDAQAEVRGRCIQQAKEMYDAGLRQIQ